MHRITGKCPISQISNVKKVRNIEQPADGWRIEQSRCKLCKKYKQKNDTTLLSDLWATSINYSKVRKCILRKTSGKCDRTLFCHFGRFEYFATIWSCIFLEFLSIWSVTSKFRELWSPARQQVWPWSRSKVTVKVMTWYHRKGLVTKNTHAKYQSSTCNSAKVMAKVKVFVTDRQTDGRTDWRTDGRMRFNVPRFRESGGQKLWPRLKFLWQTDGRTDGQTDEWDLMSRAFAKAGDKNIGEKA